MSKLVNLNEQLSRALLAKLTGVGDNKDINHECGYPDHITPQMYQEMFDREGLATRLVKIFPEESWSDNPEIYETEDSGETTEFEERIKTIIDDYRLFHYLQRVDILSGIGRFGCLLIGVDDGLELDKPIEGVTGLPGTKESPSSSRNLIYLKPFAESSIKVKGREKDVTSPRYGKPTEYEFTFVKVTDDGLQGTHIQKRVHWSRVIHVADNRMESDIFGIPRLQTVYNRAIDIRKIAGGSGEMFWKGGFPGFSTKIDPEAEVDWDAIKENVEKYQQGLQRILALQGVELQPLSPQVADPTPHIKAQVMLAALSLGIPYRIFMGTEESRLAGSEDSKAWNRRIHRRNMEYVGPMIVREVIDRFIEIGILPSVEAYNVAWPDPDNLTEEEKASIAEKRTKALAAYISGNVQMMIPPEDYLSRELGYSIDEAQDFIKRSAGLIVEEEIDESELEDDEEA